MSNPERHQIEVVIVNRTGLHTRPAKEFVQVATQFASVIEVSKDGRPVNGKSIMGLMSLLAPQGDPGYSHTLEGPDDMPAHIRSAVTSTGLSLPVMDRRPALGTWQGIYLCEHRDAPHRRHIAAHLIGE